MAGSRKSGRVTIRTVATDAGVSAAAVSKVLRGAYGVSETLRAKVQASMQRLGYRPHTAARGMRGQTYTLGVLLPDLRNPFFADIVAGIDEALGRTQYQALLGVGQSAADDRARPGRCHDRSPGRRGDPDSAAHPDRRADTDRQPHPRRDHRPSSAGHAGFRHRQQRRWARRRAGRPPSVRGGLPQHSLSVARFSVAAGSRDLRAPGKGLSRGDEGTWACRGKSESCSRPQHARDIQVAARHLLESRQRPEAIFCWTDYVALEVLSVARELGFSVPEDVAVVGYDNTSYCDLSQNSLTSIDQSGQVLGLQSARLLIERIKGRTAAEHFVITPRLVARASSRRRT